MIELDDAISLLKEALGRLEKPSGNANGGTMLIGGTYWRLAHVLKFVDSQFDAQEGKEHADFIRKTHGVIKTNT